VGQALLCLREVMHQQGLQPEDKDDDAARPGVLVRTDVTLGGQFVGMLEARVRISTQGRGASECGDPLVEHDDERSLDASLIEMAEKECEP
jgi:hypothetical protein